MADPARIRRDTQRRNLDRRITWVCVTTAYNDYGEVEQVQVVLPTWAKRTDSVGELDFETGNVALSLGDRVYLVRHDSRFEVGDRIQDGEERFRVDEIEELERRRWLLAKCSEVVS